MSKRRFSMLRIIGTIKGITYYMLNGKYTSRIANPPDKNTIYYDLRFTTVKANCLEFGGASMVSKAICTGLQENIKSFKDSYFTSRLTGACRIIIQKGRGEKGAREVNLFNYPEALIGLQLHKKQVFDQIYTANPIVSINNARNNISIKIADSSMIHLNKYPKSATHFKLTAAISTVSPHNWHSKTQKYQPNIKASNALGKTIQSSVLLCKMEHPEIILNLKSPSRIPSKVAITLWLGIEFGKQKETEFTPFITAKAMQCIAIL